MFLQDWWLNSEGGSDSNQRACAQGLLSQSYVIVYSIKNILNLQTNNVTLTHLLIDL